MKKKVDSQPKKKMESGPFQRTQTMLKEGDQQMSVQPEMSENSRNHSRANNHPEGKNFISSPTADFKARILGQMNNTNQALRGQAN